MKTAHYPITILTLLSRSKEAKDELNLEARFTALKNCIECEISCLDSKFQCVCNKLKTINIPEYETVTTIQKRVDFLQNEVASKDAIIKIFLEMQTGILDSGTNCTSQNKDKITSINITDDSCIPVNNSKHKRNYDQNKKNRAKQGKNQLRKCRSRTFRYKSGWESDNIYK